jgi:hypothetical protein
VTDEEYAALREEIRARAAGCCGDAAWRGRFCPYHSGFLDGFAEATERLELP